MAGARYVRYIIFAVLCLAIIFFTTSSSAPSPGNTIETIKTASDNIQKSWTGSTQRLEPQKPAGLPGSNMKEIEEELSKIPQEESIVAPPEPPKVQAPEDTWKSTPNTKPDISPPKASGSRRNATFVTLARNGDVWDIAESIRNVEDRFNHQFNYDWVFLNDEPFDQLFKTVTTKLVSGKTRYGLIGEQHWSFPDFIDQDKAAAVRKQMAEDKIIYGDSISYRHMCRFESGFFFRQPLMNEYEWYWRVEPSIKLYCDVNYDVFKYMADNKKKYSFVLSLYEYRETIPTLWKSVQKFMSSHPEHLNQNNSMSFLSDDGGKTYNHCHFWSNFEVGNLDWLRSQAYLDFFDALDKDGGFFYERWGDAPVHSIAAALLLPKEEIHFFDDIGYWHVPFTHCPEDSLVRQERRCHCDPHENFDWNTYSCTAKFFDLNGMSHPDLH